jgi:hypothetical protein
LGNPQKIKFSSVEEFLDLLPPEEAAVVESLRELVLSSIPDCREKLAYNVPFYYRHSRIVFIWPASVPWGNLEKGVALGFCRGSELFNLDTEGKKTIGRRVFQSLREIPREEIRQLLYDAVLLDEQEHKARKKRGAKS